MVAFLGEKMQPRSADACFLTSLTLKPEEWSEECEGVQTKDRTFRPGRSTCLWFKQDIWKMDHLFCVFNWQEFVI